MLIELQSSTQASHDSQGDQKTNLSIDAPIQDSGSVSASSNDSRKVSRQDIELVQNLIERCLQLYMNRDEVVKTLLTRARIDPGFTTLVWQKLEEENADFFRAYYIRLKLKKQIILFNHLLEHQYHLMKYPPGPPKVPLAPIQNGMHPMAPVQLTCRWDTQYYNILKCMFQAIPIILMQWEYRAAMLLMESLPLLISIL
ncbi:putative protein [Arabidopsis thaliana]|uniref:Uncharacterized protein F15G16.90 n=1 Tax=Arabidopsis thaliana TaxID=3702 RepID=Q9M368_ARATH|nr:putative protein [Arabidopsis thaliana]